MNAFKKANQMEEPASHWKPTLKDAKDLSEKLKLYSKKEINGRMQYPFELYLEKQNIISFDDWGGIQVKNPLQYHLMNETESLMKWLEDKEMDTLFQAFPEEKEAYEAKKMTWQMECREVLEKFKVKAV